uniref:Uncharacterized protein n=1 Tax=Phaeomonas parva TaxID=124430 RepID=A0A7S1U0C1_9STRA
MGAEGRSGGGGNGGYGSGNGSGNGSDGGFCKSFAAWARRLWPVVLFIDIVLVCFGPAMMFHMGDHAPALRASHPHHRQESALHRAAPAGPAAVNPGYKHGDGLLQHQQKHKAAAPAVTRKGPRKASSSAPHDEKRNIVVLGAVGRPLSAAVVRYNVIHHFPAESWDCVLLTYKKESSIIEDKPEHCVVISRTEEHLGGFIRLFHESLLAGRYGEEHGHVALVLDDVLLDERTFSSDEMLRFMAHHDLHAATPLVNGVGAKWGRGESMNEVHPDRLGEALRNAHAAGSEKASPELRGIPADADASYARREAAAVAGKRYHGGRLVNAAEVFATFYTREAWGCLAELFFEENTIFHGYDACFSVHCAPKKLGRVGVHDGLMAYHMENAVPETEPPGFRDHVAAADRRRVPENFIWGLWDHAAKKGIRKKWAEKSRFFSWVHRTYHQKCASASRTIGFLLDKGSRSWLGAQG